ncbi:MAG: hypothetical protein JJU33_14175 [Phycisphaerales bacterium]|nr:hypothetical protein [Phycisphaerales bacterium]
MAASSKTKDSKTPASPDRKAQLAGETVDARKSLSEPEFSKSDYTLLRVQALNAAAILDAYGIERGKNDRLSRAIATLKALVSDAATSKPSESESYLTGLEVGRLSMIVASLAQPKGKFNEHVRALVSPDDPASPGLADCALRLQFLALCRDAKFKVEPPAELTPGEGHDGVVELDRWRVGIAAATLEASDESLEKAIETGNARLKHARLPGILVLDATSICWPERKIIRVAADRDAAGEIHRRADAFLERSLETLDRLTDADFVFGVVAIATIPTFNVARGLVAFSSSVRLAILRADTDPRAAQMERFAAGLRRDRH